VDLNSLGADRREDWRTDVHIENGNWIFQKFRYERDEVQRILAMNIKYSKHHIHRPKS